MKTGAKSKKAIGGKAETEVVRFLRKKGMDILDVNYHSRFGEIDIIACDEKYIAFVEVKARGPASIALPREAVDAAKQRKIISTASLFLAENETELQPRFDVAEVFLDKNGKICKISYIGNAFDA